MPAPTSRAMAQTVLAAVARHPQTTSAELAEKLGLGRSTVAKALAALEANGKASRVRGQGAGVRRAADRWTATDTPFPPPGPGPRPPAGPTVADRAMEGKLGKGQLRAWVLAHLRTRRDDELSPTAVAKALGRSSGAVGNALARLSEMGEVHQTGHSPRRYRAA